MPDVVKATAQCVAMSHLAATHACSIAKLVLVDFTPGGEEGAAAFRKLAHAAVRACGAHVTQGAAVHDELCAFEQDMVRAAVDEHGAEGDAAMAAAKRAGEAWGRRLRAVLVGGPEAMAEYNAWKDSLPEPLQAIATPPNLQKVSRNLACSQRGHAHAANGAGFVLSAPLHKDVVVHLCSARRTCRTSTERRRSSRCARHLKQALTRTCRPMRPW
jgi:hypothetical protein